MSVKRISIVTPSYNQAPFLERTILSVLDQDYPNIEYIVVDGGSTDGSLEIIKKYSDRLAWWTSEEDRGQTDAINKGFEHASGEVLAWLNSDDTYKPGSVRDALQQLDVHPQCSAVYGDANFINEDDRIIGHFPAAQTDLKKLKRGYVHVPQQACFFRADHWHKVGPLDPDFYFAMDYDLWLRLARLAPLVYIPGHNWANFRLHSDAKTIAADDRCWPEMLRIHYRDGGSVFSLIVMKYWIRKMAAPLINWRRKSMIQSKTQR